jgi:potassium-transporting ATPase KdpC subunit
MASDIRATLIVFGFLTLVTGVVYPGVATLVGALAFPSQTRGSLIADGKRIVGSRLIGQPFSGEQYFWSRPSATNPTPYNGAASSGSNLGPINPALEAAVSERIAALKAADTENTGLVPVDLVTASGSGLDPHISPAAAEYQISRVARVRGMNEDDVRALVRAATAGRTLGVLGEPRVSVLEVNLALDAERR